MKLLPYLAVSAVLGVAASASPTTATSPKDVGITSAGATAAAAGWGMAYEMDPKTGRYALIGFADPDGKVVPFDEGQRGYVADARTGRLTPLVPGRSISSPLANAPHYPGYLASESVALSR
ncbi:hypothetical protein ABZ707_30305 [Streptomyces sp. NPDC006923]|uniref:hypothetical protein n=1 Tax=Streptomyces sp. NPDC006923 TaxID=3155355 RepID=UPI0033DB1193